MKTIKISDEATTYKGRLPESWAEVPLKKYTDLVNSKTLPARCVALAALVGLPAEPLLEDVSLFAIIRQAAPFLFDGPLPDEGAPVASFEHEGVKYSYIGDMHKLTGQQYEALDSFLQQSKADEAEPLAVAHKLLAVLYVPTGQPQTAEVVEATAKAFETLPLSLAWPALMLFFSRSYSSAQAIQTYLAVGPQAKMVLHRVGVLISDSQASCWSLRRWLSAMWIRRVAKSL